MPKLACSKCLLALTPKSGEHDRTRSWKEKCGLQSGLVRGPVSQAQNPFLQLLTQENVPGAHICSYMMFTENERLIWRRNSQEIIMEWLYLHAQNYGYQITLCLGNDLAQTHHSSTALLLLRPVTNVLMWSWRVIPGCRGSTRWRTWESPVAFPWPLPCLVLLCNFMCMRHSGLGRLGWGAGPTESPDYGKGASVVSCTAAGLGANLAVACSPSRDVLQVQSCWQ